MHYISAHHSEFPFLLISSTKIVKFVQQKGHRLSIHDSPTPLAYSAGLGKLWKYPIRSFSPSLIYQGISSLQVLSAKPEKPKNMKKMTKSGSPFLFWFSFFCLLPYLPVSFAKSPLHRFPSSLISPKEKLSLSAHQNQPYRTKYFTQILDHFNYYPKSYQSFQQRYLINDTYWGGAKSNAPIFVYTGNEGNIEWFAQNTGFLYETAPHFKALIIFIEVS